MSMPLSKPLLVNLSTAGKVEGIVLDEKTKQPVCALITDINPHYREIVPISDLTLSSCQYSNESDKVGKHDVDSFAYVLAELQKDNSENIVMFTEHQDMTMFKQNLAIHKSYQKAFGNQEEIFTSILNGTALTYAKYAYLNCKHPVIVSFIQCLLTILTEHLHSELIRIIGTYNGIYVTLPDIDSFDNFVVIPLDSMILNMLTEKTIKEIYEIEVETKYDLEFFDFDTINQLWDRFYRNSCIKNEKHL